MQEEQTQAAPTPQEPEPEPTQPEAQAAPESAEAAEPTLTEVPEGPRRRKRTKVIALAVLGLCCCFLMVGIGLLSTGLLTALGIVSLVAALLLLLLGIYLNAASRLISYTDGSTRWDWELKKEASH